MSIDCRILIVLACLSSLWSLPVRAAELGPLLETIRRVEADGHGTRPAALAWTELSKSDPADLVSVLSAIDDAGPLAANWLRIAVDAIAESALSNGGTLPKDALEEFILRTDHDPRARRLAFEWLHRVDSDAADRLIPGMLDDPSVEFRRDAVGRLIEQANQFLQDDLKVRAAGVYRDALNAARDNDQIKLTVHKLKSLGEDVDLPSHFGFLTKWRVMGPFDNTDRKGFEEVFPPEHQLSQTAQQGKSGTVGWVGYETTDDYGMVDLNEPLGSLKEAVGYARTLFDSERAQEVELRLGCKNAWKLWLNGEFLFGRDEYHRGMSLDQYRMKATLRPGVNQILVKLCQNEEVEDWTVEWEFQLRVCDKTGTAILSRGRGD